MIIKEKSVIGLNVVTIDNGSVVETVDDIAYDPTNHRIVALLVDSGGMFSSAKAIHMDDVRNIGEDAVIIPNADAIKSIDDLGDDVRSISNSNKHLVKTNVLTVDGKELGRVTDIYFESTNGTVDSMEVSQGGLKTLAEGKKSIKPADIITIGADATIVSTYTEMKLDEQGEEGGLKGALNNAKESVQEAAEKTAETVKEASENAKEKAVELRDIAADKAEDAREVITEKTAETRDTLEEKTAQARIKADELKDDVIEKADELETAARSKADEVQKSARKSDVVVREKAEELANELQDKARDTREVAKQKASETQQKVSELTNEAHERFEDGKEEIKARIADQGTTRNLASDKVVEKTARYEDEEKIISTKKTVTQK